jgi:hypothetical protein
MDDDEKERKDFELLSIPCESKFNAALRRMAFFNESSSVAEAPSTDTPLKCIVKLLDRELIVAVTT